jgi:hypothetical protein
LRDALFAILLQEPDELLDECWVASVEGLGASESGEFFRCFVFEDDGGPLVCHFSNGRHCWCFWRRRFHFEVVSAWRCREPSLRCRRRKLAFLSPGSMFSTLVVWKGQFAGAGGRGRCLPCGGSD